MNRSHLFQFQNFSLLLLLGEGGQSRLDFCVLADGEEERNYCAGDIMVPFDALNDRLRRQCAYHNLVGFEKISNFISSDLCDVTIDDSVGDIAEVLQTHAE